MLQASNRQSLQNLNKSVEHASETSTDQFLMSTPLHNSKSYLNKKSSSVRRRILPAKTLTKRQSDVDEDDENAENYENHPKPISGNENVFIFFSSNYVYFC